MERIKTNNYRNLQGEDLPVTFDTIPGDIMLGEDEFNPTAGDPVDEPT